MSNSSSTRLSVAAVAILVFIVFAGLFFLFKEDKGGKSLFLLSGLIASYYAWHNREKENWKRISRGILLGLSTLLFLFLVASTVRAAVSKDQWDFMCFYMQGLLGVHHLNFYDPGSFQILLGNINFPYSFSPAFKAEILDVGLLSPPVTMLLYAPFSSLDYETSKLIFSALIFVFIVINTFLIDRVFFKMERSLFSLQFVFIILMLLPGTIETIFYRQTNFFLLFFLLLIINNINKPTAGIYLALSVIIKPISAFLILFFIINRKWKSLISFLVTGGILVVITGLIWGFNNITGFFKSLPTKRLPHYLYEQPVNQSLIAILNRNLKVYGLSQSWVNLTYYFAAAVLICLTVVVSRRLSRIGMQISFFPFIACMLLIYPSSLDHYMIYLLPVIIYMLSLKFDKVFLVISFILALGFLQTEVFFTYIIIWSMLLLIAFFYPGIKLKDQNTIS